MAELELKLFDLLNKNIANPVFDNLVPIFSFLGEYNLSLALALFLVLVFRKNNKMIGIVLLAGLLASGFVVFILKTGFPRNMPFLTLENVRQAVEETDWGPCFPSGHATCAFLVATVLSIYFRRGYLLFFIAIAASVVRVYNGVHYASDIIVGAMIGIVTGYAVIYVARKTEKFHQFFINIVSRD